MSEAVLRVRTEGGAEVQALVDRLDRAIGSSRSRRVRGARDVAQQEATHYRQSAAAGERGAREDVERARRVSRARLRELALQGAAQDRFSEAFSAAHKRATAIMEQETGRRGNLTDREKRQAEDLALAMIANHERAERRKTETSRRESKRREAIAREAAATVSEIGGRVHAATQAPRMEVAEINSTLASAFGEAGATRAEVGSMQARVMAFARDEGIDPTALALGLQHGQQQFSTLQGDTPEARRAALEEQLSTAKLAHDTLTDPEQMMRLRGALGANASPELLRQAVGITRRGGVELGAMTAQQLRTIAANTSAAGSNARRLNPNASEADVLAAQREAFTQTLTELEVFAPRGLQGASAGTADRQLKSALHDPRIQRALMTRIRNEFGADSRQTDMLFQGGRLREEFLGAQGAERFGRVMTTIAGGDPDRVRALLGRGTRQGDRDQVLMSNQRELVALMSGQDERGRTGWDIAENIRAGARDVGDADVARTRSIVQAEDITNLTRARVRGMIDARTPSTVRDVSDTATDWMTSHPMLAAVAGPLAGLLGKHAYGAIARNAPQAAAGLGAAGAGAAALVAGAAGGGVLLYPNESIVGGDEESRMLAAARARHRAPPGAGRAAPVELSDRSVERLASAVASAHITATISEHDAVHAATAATTRGQRAP